MINWNQMSEAEFLDMLADKYTSDGYNVDYLHNRRELGADLLARKDSEEIVILAKINPVQADLSQPPLAKINHASATKYVYYYVGEASAPFISVMRNTHPEFELYNQDQTETMMLNSNNIYAFRFLLKYSSTVAKIARIIQKAYTDASTCTTPDISLDETLFQTLLGAHEGIVQFREITKIAVASLQELIQEYQDYTNEILIKKTLKSTCSFVSLLDNASNKLDRLLELNSHYVNHFFRGTSVWGGTTNGEFLPLNLDHGSWSRYSNQNEKRHYYKILDYIVVGFRERYPDYNYGVPEAVGCFMCLEDILGMLKKASERFLIEVFRSRLNPTSQP